MVLASSNSSLNTMSDWLRIYQTEGWDEDQLETIDANALQTKNLQEEGAIMLDLRKPGEWDNGHLSYAINRPLDFLNESMRELDAKETYYLHCGSGYRSTIAGSILKARGFENLVNVQDKVADILATEAAETA